MRLWTGWAALALLIAILIASNVLAQPNQAISHRDLGLDFVAFYRAGVLVRTGRTDELYDLESTRQFDRDLAVREQLSLGDKFGPFLNPPLFAWIYAPLTRLGYDDAVFAWTLISAGCFAAAMWLLMRMIPSTAWQHFVLVPALAATSLPFLQTLGHAQNCCLSLLIASAAVTAWRKGYALAAGMVGALLIYKPQLAAVVLIGMTISLGWRAAAGACITCIAFCTANIVTLPGTLSQYIRRIGPDVHYMMATHPYIWARHVTFRAFWQVLLNRANPGANSAITIYLSIACTAALGMTLLIFVWRSRAIVCRDRVIAAVIATAPLLMPYYLDYDLLLLAIPATLLAAETVGREPARWVLSRDRWLVRLWIGLYLLLLINPGLTGTIHCNLAVPLLAAIATISILRTRPEKLVLVATPMFDDTLRLGPVFRALAS
jgi:hypothetical protein